MRRQCRSGLTKEKNKGRIIVEMTFSCLQLKSQGFLGNINNYTKTSLTILFHHLIAFRLRKREQLLTQVQILKSF